MAKLSLKERQKRLDLKKWLDSKSEQKDTCGSYDYCQFCDKLVQYPCAKAFMKMEKESGK